MDQVLPITVWEALLVYLSDIDVYNLSCATTLLQSQTCQELSVRKTDVDIVRRLKTLIPKFFTEWTLQELLVFLQAPNPTLPLLLNMEPKRANRMQEASAIKAQATARAAGDLDTAQVSWVTKCKARCSPSDCQLVVLARAGCPSLCAAQPLSASGKYPR